MWNKLIGKRRSKYGNKQVVYEGAKFDSKKELARYLFLKEAEAKGLISNLQRQVKFELLPAVREEYVEHLKTKDVVRSRVVQQAVYYRCDFAYVKNGEQVIEDVKAAPKSTALDKSYTLKKKMMKSLKGITIKEVFNSNDEI